MAKDSKSNIVSGCDKLSGNLSRQVHTCDTPSGNLSHLLSIIVPCYNCAEFLPKLIESLAAQEQFGDCEIILVNDGSTDGGKTLQACNDFASKYPENLHVVDLKENVGLPGARNAGIVEAKGDYILFLDADDDVVSEFLETLFENISSCPETDIFVYGANEIHYDKMQVSKTVSIVPTQTSVSDKDSIKKLALDLEKQTLFGYAWNKIYKASLITENGLRFEDVHLIEDVLFNIRAFGCAGEVATIDVALYNYYRRNEAKSTESSSPNSSITHLELPDYFKMNSRRVQEMYDWMYGGNDDEQLAKDGLQLRAKEILGAEYVRYTYSEIMRNVLPLPKSEHKTWLDEYYDKHLTKKLLDAAKPEGKIAVEMANALRSRKASRVFALARLVRFVNDHMQWLMIRLRQSR